MQLWNKYRTHVRINFFHCFCASCPLLKWVPRIVIYPLVLKFLIMVTLTYNNWNILNDLYSLWDVIYNFLQILHKIIINKQLFCPKYPTLYQLETTSRSYKNYETEHEIKIRQDNFSLHSTLQLSLTCTVIPLVASVVFLRVHACPQSVSSVFVSYHAASMYLPIRRGKLTYTRYICHDATTRRVYGVRRNCRQYHRSPVDMKYSQKCSSIDLNDLSWNIRKEYACRDHP